MKRQLSYKKSLLVICKISRLFPNTLSADGNKFRCNYLENKKPFLDFFLHFRNLVSIWNIFNKKITLIEDVFPKLRILKTSLDQCLKSPVSEDPSKSNLLNRPNHCSKLMDISFTICSDHWEGNSLAKSLCFKSVS